MQLEARLENRDDLGTGAGDLVGLVARLVRDSSVELAPEFGHLTLAQLRILSVVAGAGQIDTASIASTVGASPARVAVVLAEIARDGLVACDPDFSDQRRRVARPLPAGLAAAASFCDAAGPFAGGTRTRLLRSLSSSALLDLRSGLNALVAEAAKPA